MNYQNEYFNSANSYNPMNAFNQLVTNVTFVTSVEEALFRASSRNSEMVFFHQDKPIFYRVKVDNEGRKSWAQYDYGTKPTEDNTPVTRAELSELVKKIAVLEEKLNLNDGGTINE